MENYYSIFTDEAVQEFHQCPTCGNFHPPSDISVDDGVCPSCDWMMAMYEKDDSSIVKYVYLVEYDNEAYHYADRITGIDQVFLDWHLANEYCENKNANSVDYEDYYSYFRYKVVEKEIKYNV